MCQQFPRLRYRDVSPYDLDSVFLCCREVTFLTTKSFLGYHLSLSLTLISLSVGI